MLREKRVRQVFPLSLLPSEGWFFCNGEVGVKAIGLVLIDQAILAIEQVLIGDLATVVGLKDEAGFEILKLCGEFCVGHVASPQAL